LTNSQRGRTPHCRTNAVNCLICSTQSSHVIEACLAPAFLALAIAACLQVQAMLGWFRVTLAPVASLALLLVSTVSQLLPSCSRQTACLVEDSLERMPPRPSHRQHNPPQSALLVAAPRLKGTQHQHPARYSTSAQGCLRAQALRHQWSAARGRPRRRQDRTAPAHVLLDTQAAGPWPSIVASAPSSAPSRTELVANSSQHRMNATLYTATTQSPFLSTQLSRTLSRWTRRRERVGHACERGCQRVSRRTA
jgi:hypothetical protein